MERADVAALTERARDFHGHMCPGLAIGIQAARIGLAVCGHDSDEDVVAVVETDMCAVDAIQALMGCTFGKGNLVHRDYGKAAFTFFRRRDGSSGIGTRMRASVSACMGGRLDTSSGGASCSSMFPLPPR